MANYVDFGGPRTKVKVAQQPGNLRLFHMLTLDF
jgi:hypothetical protein